MSHFAHVSFLPKFPGSDPGSIRWWNRFTGSGTVVLKGTTAHSPLERRNLGEITTTGRFLTISGGLNPVSKSQISNVPGFG